MSVRNLMGESRNPGPQHSMIWLIKPSVECRTNDGIHRGTQQITARSVHFNNHT